MSEPTMVETIENRLKWLGIIQRPKPWILYLTVEELRNLQYECCVPRPYIPHPSRVSGEPEEKVPYTYKGYEVRISEKAA